MDQQWLRLRPASSPSVPGMRLVSTTLFLARPALHSYGDLFAGHKRLQSKQRCTGQYAFVFGCVEPTKVVPIFWYHKRPGLTTAKNSGRLTLYGRARDRNQWVFCCSIIMTRPLILMKHHHDFGSQQRVHSLRRRQKQNTSSDYAA